MGKMVKLGLILAIFCVISAGGLAYVYMMTQPKIDQNAQLALERSKQEVMPASGKGMAVIVEPQGYGGKVKMMVGVDESGRVSGVKILEHRETPGLGAQIVTSKFLGQFKGKTIADKLEVEAITGASISSRAVAAGVKEALEKVKTKK